ncbi:hydantoinase/oxoprolinase N-terminal domain-containing protein [Primorskyibacter sp. S187A]|uniref:hydantoinase/oxoprolinase N-terminal domain-containing protein n=1 Tax=Primorskyibacter sp. S187A TaxID=3415130 RepID=UPI003C7B96C8
MALALGVDTGGTYTDAVLMRDEREILARAKALTTKQDLSLGIGAAVGAVLAEARIDPGEIAMAALSTTLATNALVEGQGGRIGFVAIGFAQSDLDKHGLAEAMRGDPVLIVAGGHTHAGSEAAALDLDAVRDWAAGLDGITGFAVAGQFATRNPAHERAVADVLRGMAPVSSSHELSAKLGGPKRAMTAVLNARLIGLTHALIGKAEDELAARGVDAPLMVVRGDGALMSAAQAKRRPIETILSGPAASIVGARWLTGAEQALVADIGGTTTDIALLRDGRPAIDPDGARVGPYRTMVEAVAMRTLGLGGDSEVALRDGLQGGITLGPRRVVPVALMALDGDVRAVLEAQLRQPVPGEHDARFVRQVILDPGGLDARETALLARIDGVQPLGHVLRNRIDSTALARLRARGIVQVAGLTPSDAAHVLGHTDAWDAQAAEMALALMARRRAGHGDRLAADALSMAQMIEAELHRSTGLALLETAFAEEPLSEAPPRGLAEHVLMQRGLAGHTGLIRLDAALNTPVVGLGASARTYYPKVGKQLGCEMLLPEDGGVANAIGAVVGRITVRREGVVTAPAEGRYRAHLEAGPADFASPDAAMEAVTEALQAEVKAAAEEAGAADVDLRVAIDKRSVQLEAREVFVEAVIRVEASGRARVAR